MIKTSQVIFSIQIFVRIKFIQNIGNINEEEFVQIFIQIFEGEDTGEQKTV